MEPKISKAPCTETSGGCYPTVCALIVSPMASSIKACMPFRRCSFVINLAMLYMLVAIALPGLVADEILPEANALSCSACLWTAKALRSGLVEKMPRRVKAKDRRRLTEEAFDEGICAAQRFPTQLVRLDAKLGHMKLGYHDFSDVRGDKRTALTSEHFQLLGTSDSSKEAVSSMCLKLTRAFRSAVVDKAEAHKARIFGAITDHWLCVRQARLCSAQVRGSAEGLANPTG
ncbi:unnamed protein product [Durusdinium trenchii]|uniref:DUF3456 domain-containing protein n=1 Tax=Durusdinium trenchii TaxID=1381693 RepID=A0ABP0KJA9_9DINO